MSADWDLPYFTGCGHCGVFNLVRYATRLRKSHCSLRSPGSAGAETVCGRYSVPSRLITRIVGVIDAKDSPFTKAFQATSNPFRT